MKKIILLALSALVLTACGEDKKESNSSALTKNELMTIYAVDGFTGEYDINELLLFTAMYANGKTYTFDKNGSLSIAYENLPIFKTEVLRQILTPKKYFSHKSQHLTNYQYVLGDEASFDGRTLSYRLKSEDANLNVSVEFEKINVSGLPINSDMNNPIHKISLSPNSQIIAAIYGVGYSDLDTFPKDSICWQKKSAYSNEDYIEFYPKNSVRHASLDSQILRTQIWDGIEWSEYEVNPEEKEIANIKVSMNSKEYWGFYQSSKQFLDDSPDVLKCDFMNEIAYNAVMPVLRKYRNELEKDALDSDLLHLMWYPGYVDGVDLNPIRSDASEQSETLH